MSSPFRLTIAEVLKPTDIPSVEVVIAASREVLAASDNWKRGKSHYKNKVHTYFKSKAPGDGASWHCRVSEHTAEDATFDEFWGKLGSNHTENEKEFIDDVKKVTLLKKISATQEIWSIYYEFASIGVSPRVFTVLQTTHYDPDSPRTGIFTCIPIDVTGDPEMAKLEQRAVKGRYCSVECVKELPNGNTEWRMATTSSPGGRIPAILVDNTMGSTISADVHHFLKWFHTVRHKANGVTGTAVPVKEDKVPPVTPGASELDPTADIASVVTAAGVPGLAAPFAVPVGAGAPVA